MSWNYIVYDDGCRLCKLWKNFIVTVDSGRDLKPISIPNADRLGLSDNVKPSDQVISLGN